MNNNSWVGPSSTEAVVPQSQSQNQTQYQYRALVLDSGPIIKNEGLKALFTKAQQFYTVPAVMEEIKDAKARTQFQQQLATAMVQSDLIIREPSKEAMSRVIEFSKLTGDYPSLSKVDLQVLALTVDLEIEGTLTSDHVRTTPKRTIGLGNITTLNPKQQQQQQQKGTNNNNTTTDDSTPQPPSSQQIEQGQDLGHVEYDIVEDDDDEDDDDGVSDNESTNDEIDGATPTLTPTPVLPTSTATAPKSWASLLGNPTSTVPATAIATTTATPSISNNNNNTTPTNFSPSTKEAGQFDDAEEDHDVPDLQAELELEFPSLAAAATVPYEGEENEEGQKQQAEADHGSPDDTLPLPSTTSSTTVSASTFSTMTKEEQERERKKQEALKPISKSGKLYNSFRKYGKLMKPKPPTTTTSTAKQSTPAAKSSLLNIVKEGDETTDRNFDPTQSRILGVAGASTSAGTTATPEMNADDDDGEGWITSTKDIVTLKNNIGGGQLDPIKSTLSNNNNNSNNNTAAPTGPPDSHRTACTTTDFAMQNVLLQMGLCLLSVDGMRIRRLKSWVLRCGACFKIHTDPVDPKTGLRRMFCGHCGSDMMQRVSASVDGKTGRLKLHFSKKYKNNLRGTKFSLPKPGSGNRFQGDLLLREDQLMMGAWNQKVKKNSGGQSRAHAQSIFGKDIATNVGCNASVIPNDIRVGFGRQNPNSAKGRERRGKKKKSNDRACGLRRY